MSHSFCACGRTQLLLNMTVMVMRNTDTDSDRGMQSPTISTKARGHENHDREGDQADDNGAGGREKGNRGHYRDHDRELHDWYRGHEGHLPPGLAKRDALPPGLERQLVVRGTLPPGLQRRMHPCPQEVEQYLPPAPVGYMHTVIGGHIALVNRKTFVVLDVFQF